MLLFHFREKTFVRLRVENYFLCNTEYYLCDLVIIRLWWKGGKELSLTFLENVFQQSPILLSDNNFQIVHE